MSREDLAPPLLPMGSNRCYRVNLVHDDFGGNPAAAGSQQQQQQKQVYMEQDLYVEDDEEEDETTFSVEELINSTFKLTMHVPSSFYGGLIGFKGSTKRRIESETHTDINVPRGGPSFSGDGSGGKCEDVVIKGKTRVSVCAARRKINLLVNSLRRRMRITHFVGVTLQSPIRENFIVFKQQVLAANLPGIDETLFQTDNCIHLTLVGCVLLDDAERAKAVEILQSCRDFLTDLPTPMELKITGLEIMNDDPSAVRVLYACVEEAPVLQEFANRISRRFVQSGLSSDQDAQRDRIKLHMTVMNNRYRLKLNEQAEQTFDAREVLKRFANFDFGTAQCNEVQLCVLHGSTSQRQPYIITGTLQL